jgi:hypothetical protein
MFAAFSGFSLMFAGCEAMVRRTEEDLAGVNDL